MLSLASMSIALASESFFCLAAFFAAACCSGVILAHFSCAAALAALACSVSIFDNGITDESSAKADAEINANAPAISATSSLFIGRSSRNGSGRSVSCALCFPNPWLGAKKPGTFLIIFELYFNKQQSAALELPQKLRAPRCFEEQGPRRAPAVVAIPCGPIT